MSEVKVEVKKGMTVEELKNRDYIVLVDMSGSMGENDCPGNSTRWDHAQEGTLAIARKAMEYDNDGITVGFFNGDYKMYENVKDGADQLKQIFGEHEPQGGTDTAKVFKEVLGNYVKNRANAKPITVVCITDGRPEDPKALAKVIIDAANAIEDEKEIGISFVQVGKDGKATAFLKELDNDLTSEGAKFDIVSTVTCEDFNNKSMTDILIEAVTA